MLAAGEVGYVTAGIKELRAAKVGDTMTLASKPAAKPLPGFKEIKPQVFAGLYPVEASEYEALRDALEKLHLNDASFHYEPETSQALGFGFRCGFLGLLHMDIVQERLEREYGMHLITTAPSVVYEVKLRDGTLQQVSNPSRLPAVETIEEFREPIMACKIFVPQDYVGPVISLCTDKRGTQTNMHYSARHVVISYDLPLNEVVLDFFDRLKSMTRGYGSLDYEFKEYRAADMVRLDILVNGEKVDALSSMVHRSASQHRGRELVTKLRSLIPRQMFDVAVQAAIGGHIIARENVKALRKNVIAKCYGGDITRKRKLLDKQKEGKKRMKQVGAVEIPQEAFLAVLQRGDQLNFALFLLILLLVTGAVWLLDKLVLRKGRSRDAKQPWWVEYSISFFPVILIVFLLRSFLVEPFKIPSSSMVPTLLVGDFILVNKFTYGIRLPVANRKIVALGTPERGDVMVFRFPEDPSLDYIKRVVGLPGDRIEYRNKKLSLNGSPVPVRQVDDYLSKERMQFSRRFVEILNGAEHEILLDEDAPAGMMPGRAFPYAGNCNYNSSGLACTVPPGHYFVMGDNRDNSSDSRVWGFVPDENIVGKAFFIWLNLNELGRFGRFR